MPSKILICETADDSLKPGHERAHFCRNCGREVQVSPTGRLQLDQGAIPTCNPCGFALLKNAGVEGRVAGTVINPTAQRQMDERKRHAQEAARSKCDVCGAKTDRFWVWHNRAFGLMLAGRRMDVEAGEWAFCVYCAALFGSRDARALGARAHTLIGPGGNYELLYAVLMDATEWDRPPRVEAL